MQIYLPEIQLQRDAVIWMYESAVSVFKPEGAAYLQSLHKLIFLELFLRDEQWRADGWPTEQERSLFSSACTQVGHEIFKSTS